MKYFIFVAVSILITSCSNSSDENTPLIGRWVTQACTQATNSNGALVDAWFKANYEFTATGLVFFEPEQYTDSQCVTRAQTQTTENPDPVATYADQDESILQEGIQGHGITLSFITPTDTPKIDGFYTINDGALCFSGIFIFEPLKFGYSEVGGDSAINFDDCLVKL